jgi:hypothetical protein
VSETEITKRLDAIIALLATTLPKPEQPRSLTEQIQLLAAAGIGPTDIGRMLGKKPKDVTSVLARLKRTKR